MVAIMNIWDRMIYEYKLPDEYQTYEDENGDDQPCYWAKWDKFEAPAYEDSYDVAARIAATCAYDVVESSRLPQVLTVLIRKKDDPSTEEYVVCEQTGYRVNYGETKKRNADGYSS